MNDTIQQILVGAAVVGSVVYLFLRGRRKKGGCNCESNGVGCAAKDLVRQDASPAKQEKGGPA
jgi:hypothetical protein